MGELGKILACLDQVAVVTDEEFVRRVQQAAVWSAIAIQAEAANTPNHVNRSGFALAVLHDPLGRARLMAYGLVSQGIGLASSDKEIGDMVSALWNAYAGVL